MSLWLVSMTFAALAPDRNSLIINHTPAINAYSGLLYATGMVESKGNTLAFNEQEGAVGIFQIRQVRVDDYNIRTGSNYVLGDMFDYFISEKIFLYFATLHGPYDLERIAKAWNGSGPKTELYWQKIKTYLE